MTLLKQYTFSLAIGVFAILLTGILLHGGSSGSPTGYVIIDGKQSIAPAGNTVDIKIISKDCRLTPKESFANAGDRVRLYATVYDPTGRAHKIASQQLGIEIRVQGNELDYAEFTAVKGTYEIIDAYPCKALGINAKSSLIVR